LVSGKKDSISVYLSDNGSVDDTASVLEEYKEIFRANGISLSCDSWSDNQGFDRNVMRCYEKCAADYLWLLSDDDNVIRGAVTIILADINAINPNVIYYNFGQHPYGFDNPWVKEKALYYTINTSEAVEKIVHWPKLSAIVIRKNNGTSGLKVSQMKSVGSSGFVHVALALQTVFDHGGLLLSSDFVAYPDGDFMNHIDFPPYIFNSLISVVYELCDLNQKMPFYPLLRRRYVSPLNSSLSWLSSFYFGKRMLTLSLKQKLVGTVKQELRRASFVKSKQLGFIKESLIFLAAYVFYLGRIMLTGKKGVRIRNENQ
jgi:glycosyltransferase involved in cell wall biosynthesis